MAFLRFVHLFAFVFWYGTLLYFTLIQAPVLFKSLPRQLFGEVQSHLFPTYYLISYVCGTILVVTYHLLHPLKNYITQDCVKITALCLMLLFSLAQGLWIGPKVAQFRVTRISAEEAKDTAKTEVLSKEFGKAHGISSLFNLIVIFSGTVYFVYLFKDFQN
jgi:putative copper export protein